MTWLLTRELGPSSSNIPREIYHHSELNRILSPDDRFLFIPRADRPTPDSTPHPSISIASV